MKKAREGVENSSGPEKLPLDPKLKLPTRNGALCYHAKVK